MSSVQFTFMMVIWSLLLCNLALVASELPPSQYQVVEAEWDVNHQKGIMKGQNLRLSKLRHPTNPYHTCYRVACSGVHCVEHGRGEFREFCYPAVVVTGLPKCGTSAIYDLLAKLPGAITMHEKENCPYTRRRAHYLYFHSLPEISQVKENSIIIDGCIDSTNNMRMREMLRNPNTFYLVMIRDYADMLWSSYNFWCKVPYDPHGCAVEKWTVKGFHIRAADIFHDLIIADRDSNMSVVQPFHYPMHRPCHNAGGYYSEYIDINLKTVPRSSIVVVASEEMDIAPLKVIRHVAETMNFTVNWNEFSLGNFSKVRINAQSNKGSANSVSLLHYQPGVYNISDFKPIFPETRVILNKCWEADCLEMEKRTGFKYKACHPQLEAHSQFERALSKVNQFVTEHGAALNAGEATVVKKGEVLIHEMMVAHALDRLFVPHVQLTAGL